MKYILNGRKEHLISNEELLKIRHNLDLYDMYLEYTKETDKKVSKIKELEEKLDNNKIDKQDYIDHKNIVKNQNQSSKLIVSLRKELEDKFRIKEEYDDLLLKFDNIDNTIDEENRERLINELNVEEDYKYYKKRIKKEYEIISKEIDKLKNKIIKIEDNVNIVDIDDLNINSEVISNFNVKINSINYKIKRNKKSIKKNNKKLKGLSKELDSILQLNGFENVQVYTEYLHNLNFIVKSY